MGVDPSIDITAGQRKTILTLLERHLPGTETWVYGSRAKWTSRPQSDLDLVVFATTEQGSQVGKLREAFEESDLPFRVDLFIWDEVPEQFREQIEADHITIVRQEENRLAAGRREVFWGDLATLEYGRALRKYDAHDGSFRVYGTNGPIGWHSEALCDHASVIVGRKGAYRGIHYSSAPFFVIDTAFYLKPKVEMDVRWAYYALLTQDINGMDSGTAIPSTSRDEFYALPASFPSMSEQHAIAHILGTLDDKIELNRRMNETLETMARALFKSWFVDFDPVIAKMDGRDPGLPEDLADLFPDRLAHSEMGEIPEGWKVEPIYDFADVVYGAPFASKQFNTERLGVPLIRIRDLATHEPGVSTQQVHNKGHLIEPGDIVAGMDGEFRLHVWKGPKAWLNQRVCHFEPKPGVPTAFLVEALRAPLAFFERGKVGTTVIHLAKSDIDTFRILRPGDFLLRAFADIAQPLLDQTVVNALHSRTLAQTRSFLMPKLIAGEIRVPQFGQAEGTLA